MTGNRVVKKTDARRLRNAKLVEELGGPWGLTFDPDGRVVPMAVLLESVPRGYDWGWLSRQNTRMHLQVVDEKHVGLHYKVWLEAGRRRTIEPERPIPGRILKPLENEIARQLPTIEMQWVNLMIRLKWLRLVVHSPTVKLVAYANTPNRFERTIDLRDHLPPKTASRIRQPDVALNSEFAMVVLNAGEDESGRSYVSIPPVLWGRE